MRIEELHNAYSGPIFMVGNGPSLLSQMELLARLPAPTWCCNYFHLWKNAPFVPDFYGISPKKKHLIPEVEAMTTWGKTKKFLVKKAFPSYLLPETWVWVPGGYDGAKAIHVQGFQGLSDELGVIGPGRATPLTQSQVAAWLGFTTFYFIGNDQTRYGHMYATSGFLAERRGNGGLGALLTSKQWDENDKTTMLNFERARQDIEAAGCKVYDCTPEGRMVQEGVVEYRSLEEVFAEISSGEIPVTV